MVVPLLLLRVRVAILCSSTTATPRAPTPHEIPPRAAHAGLAGVAAVVGIKLTAAAARPPRHQEETRGRVGRVRLSMLRKRRVRGVGGVLRVSLLLLLLLLSYRIGMLLPLWLLHAATPISSSCRGHRHGG